MVDFKYLTLGLDAMARAHRMSAMAGHLGAAVIAGYFVGEQRPDLEPEVYRGIEGDLERIIAGGSVFGRKMSRTAPLSDRELFAPLPGAKADPALIASLPEALGRNIDRPRQSGHNVIFASIAIRALTEHPELATGPRVDGIRKLIALFDGAHPGTGYFGKGKGRIRGDEVELDDDDGTPEYSDLEGMAAAVIDELIAQDPAVHRQGYGGLVHVINHAAAVADLARFGGADLVPRAVAAHRRHLRLWRNLPDLADELGPVPVSKFTPHHAAYWTSGEAPYDRALLTHRVKTMFGFDELAASSDDDARKARAYDQLRQLM